MTTTTKLTKKETRAARVRWEELGKEMHKAETAAEWERLQAKRIELEKWLRF